MKNILKIFTLPFDIFSGAGFIYPISNICGFNFFFVRLEIANVQSGHSIKS